MIGFNGIRNGEVRIVIPKNQFIVLANSTVLKSFLPISHKILLKPMLSKRVKMWIIKDGREFINCIEKDVSEFLNR